MPAAGWLSLTSRWRRAIGRPDGSDEARRHLGRAVELHATLDTANAPFGERARTLSALALVEAAAGRRPEACAAWREAHRQFGEITPEKRAGTLAEGLEAAAREVAACGSAAPG